MEMCAEGVLGISENLGCTAVNPTFTVIIEGREAKEIDNNFLLANVAIVKHKSSRYIATFPRLNRKLEIQTRDDLKTQLLKYFFNYNNTYSHSSYPISYIYRAGKNGWTFKSVLADLQLLLFLCDYMDISSDMGVICDAILSDEIPIQEGYQLIIRSVAGIDM